MNVGSALRIFEANYVYSHVRAFICNITQLIHIYMIMSLYHIIPSDQATDK